MRQTAALALAALVIGCAGQNPGPAADRQGGHPPAGLAAAPMCRLSPEGGPILADRGIGGTGAPAAKFTPAAAGAAQLAERGIGGTGIVGVITGFASVCVNGLEVTYDDAVPVDLDGTATPLSALRAGQVVVIKANGPAGAPHAQTMSLRQEVSGRIEAVELGSGLLTIAGVPVSVPADTWGANRFGLGDWVAVSGLPRADGVVVASRLDVAPPGVFNVHGRIVQEGTAASIGRLTLPLSMAAGVQDGQPVIVTGVYTEGRKQPVAVNPDTLSADPATYFGPSVNRMVMQAFVRVASGSVWLNGRKVAATPALRGVTGPDGLAVVSLERKPNGSLSATEVRAADLHVHTVATASGSRGAGLGNTVAPGARHASLPPTRPDGAGVAAPANYQPPAAVTSVVTMPATPPVSASVMPSGMPPSSSTPAGTLSSVPASIAVPPANAPLVTTVPPPAGIPMVSPSILAAPSVGVASSSVPVPVPMQVPTPAPMPMVVAPATVQAPPPLVPPVGVPQIESVYAPLISSNDGATASPSAVSARNGASTVLASQANHAASLPGLISKPSISLVTTVVVPNPTAASSIMSALRASPVLSPLGARAPGRH